MLTIDQILGIAELFNRYPIPGIKRQQFTFQCDECTDHKVTLKWCGAPGCLDYECRWRVMVDHDIIENCTVTTEWAAPWSSINLPKLKLDGWYLEDADNKVLNELLTALRNSLTDRVDSLLKPLAERPAEKPKKKLFRVNMAETQYGTGYVWAWNSTDAHELGREYADNGDIDVDEQNTDVEVEEVDDPSDISPYDILNSEEDDDD